MICCYCYGSLLTYLAEGATGIVNDWNQIGVVECHEVWAESNRNTMLCM